MAIKTFQEILVDLRRSIDGHAYWCPPAQHLELLDTMSVTLDAALQSSVPGTERHDDFEAMQRLVLGCRRDYL